MECKRTTSFSACDLEIVELEEGECSRAGRTDKAVIEDGCCGGGTEERDGGFEER